MKIVAYALIAALTTVAITMTWGMYQYAISVVHALPF
jgi:hypothetical protein